MNEDKTRVYLRGKGPHFEKLREQLEGIAKEHPDEVQARINGKDVVP